MADTKKKGTPAEADAPKRKMLTPEERVAKLEAELAAARERADKKANKERDTLVEKRNKLGQKRDALDAQIAQIEQQLDAIGGATVTVSTEDTSA